MADLSMSPDTGDTTPRAPEPGDLAVAVRLAEHTLDSRNPTATREALRILLRATLAQHAPNSHPDMDEALRRVRGGQA